MQTVNYLITMDNAGNYTVHDRLTRESYCNFPIDEVITVRTFHIKNLKKMLTEYKELPIEKLLENEDLLKIMKQVEVSTEMMTDENEREQILYAYNNLHNTSIRMEELV